MAIFLNYNISIYINSIKEVNCVILDSILNPYKNCKEYVLNGAVSEYLKYISKEPFYIPPSFSEVKTDKKISTLNPKFVLFSAPGATGKSSLAQHIAYKFNALYWNLSKVKVGTNSFAGSILNAVGAAKYSEFVADLNSGDVMLIIDAFDEAEIISGRKMLSSFLEDIDASLTNHQVASVCLLARTETAQFIASFCAEKHIPIVHYEIGFFNEQAAKDFVVKSVEGNKTPSKPVLECTESYYNVIKSNITEEERLSFLGYAPVLEAIATHIKATPNRQKMISELSIQKDCVSIIMKIMDDLLIREQEKKVCPAFIEKCKEAYPEFTEWEKLYSPEEQLVRIIHYILFQDTKYSNYTLDFLPSELVGDYQEILDAFLKQHPFIRNSAESVLVGREIDFTGPAFRDYTLAKIILDTQSEMLADMYFEECQNQSYFPSQIFFDCYMKISGEIVQPNHISYVYDSYKAKATVYERPYLQCSELSASGTEDSKCAAIFGMIPSKQQAKKRDDYYAEIPVVDTALSFEQLAYVSIDTPNMAVEIGRAGVDTRIYNSSIVCKEIVWKTRNIAIESYSPEGCLLVARDGFAGDSILIDIVNKEELRVSAPNISAHYKLIPYHYDFEDTSNFDIIKFIHALRCILVEFRTHRKDTLAKTAERIDFVTVGNSVIKRQVLDYLKYHGIIYTSAHLYKIDEAKMQAKGIYFNALACMDTVQMKEAFLDFCKWAQDK